MDWGWGERAGPSPVFSRKSLVGAENIDLEADFVCVCNGISEIYPMAQVPGAAELPQKI